LTDPIRTIAARDLAALRERSPAPLVVDVLPQACFEACRLPDAHNACVYEVGFADRVRELAADPAATIVVYGAGGGSHDAATAADKLTRLGYAEVRVLEGGLPAWREAGLPLHGEPGEPAPSPTPPHLADGRWRVDPAASWLRWVGRNPNGFHDGSVDLTGGEIVLEDGEARGEVTMDLATLRNFDLEGDASQPVLIAHLLSDDFLFAEAFPTATFEVTGVAPVADATLTTTTHVVHGQLTLRGVRAPLELPAIVSDRGDGRLAVEAHLELDRTRWGIIYGSARFFSHLGMHVVFDSVGITMRLELARDAS
jgi:polyisoprenoid-binding protein YceI